MRAFRLRAYLTLLGNMIHEPAFDQLRTKEQLGYIVWGGVRCFIGSLGIRIIVQSERDTVYLENRIENFLKDYLVRHCLFYIVKMLFNSLYCRKSCKSTPRSSFSSMSKRASPC